MSKHSGLTLPVVASAANCPVTHDQHAQALRASVKPSGGPGNGGLDNNRVGGGRRARRDALRRHIQRRQSR